ncbi:lysophospholipid acyltransferase family protein [bacterium]
MKKEKMNFLYFIGYLFYRLLYRIIYRVECVGLENVPEYGGAIIASNHFSYADPPLVGASLKRPLHYMAKKELFRNVVIKKILLGVNAFPVKRGKMDLDALRSAIELLQNGKLLLLFPEGTRRKKDRKPRIKKGVGFLVKKTNSVVIPVKIINSDKIFRFAKLKVIFGKPLSFAQEADAKTISERVFNTIEDL